MVYTVSQHIIDLGAWDQCSDKRRRRLLEVLQYTKIRIDVKQHCWLLCRGIFARWRVWCVSWTAWIQRLILHDVASQQLAPCPCDLTVKMCDANCCCDKVPPCPVTTDCQNTSAIWLMGCKNYVYLCRPNYVKYQIVKLSIKHCEKLTERRFCKEMVIGITSNSLKHLYHIYFISVLIFVYVLLVA